MNTELLADKDETDGVDDLIKVEVIGNEWNTELKLQLHKYLQRN